MNEERYQRRILQIDEKIAKLYTLRLKTTKKAANLKLKNGKRIKKQSKAKAFGRAVLTCPDPEFIEYLYNLFDRIYKDDNDLKTRLKKLKKLEKKK